MIEMSGLCQSDSTSSVDDIAVLSRVTSDSVTLRWAPRSFEVWNEGNIHGYVIERYTMVRDNVVIVPEKESLVLNALRPLQLEQWETIVSKNKYGAIAAQALFGEHFSVGIENTNAISIVNKVKENSQRFSFALLSADLSPEVARMSGLWLSDTTAKNGEKYLYRVLINSGSKIYRGSIFVDAVDSVVIVPPKKLSVDVKGERADLKWHAEERMKYVWFQIEKSSDSVLFESSGDIPSQTLTPNPDDVNPFHYATDSLTGSASPIFYRVRGVTPFGDVSAPSNVVSAVAKGKIGIPVITKAFSVDNKAISLSWDFPNASNQLILGFVIERGASDRVLKSIDGVSTLPSSARDFIDRAPLPINYYRISALTSAGQKILSTPYLVTLVDSIPPGEPQVLSAVVDENGKLELKWNKNSEADLYGYRVYKSNHSKEEAFQLTTAPITENNIIDRIDLRTLNKYVFYSVVAIDRNQNQSKLSNILKVKLPDQVKPLSPVMLPITSDSNGVKIYWTRSSSDDVSHYEVYRSTDKSDHWIRRKVVNGAQDSVYTFHDLLPEAGMKYRYTVVAVDSSRNESPPCSPVSAKKILNVVAPPIAWGKAEINNEQRTVKLRWTYNQKNVICFKMFKSVNDGDFSLYKSLVSGSVEFEDRVITGKSSRYKIMAVFKDGAKSLLSDQLQINF
jgi:fibronectin type 3 domain-containing protein